MALFNNGDQSAQSDHRDKTTIITQGTALSGELNLTCELYCDGEVEGAIRSTHEVSIGEKGSFKGDVFADKITVLGRIEGSVDARRIEIRSGGCIKGIITSSELVIEPKGIFEGESRIKRESDADE